MKKLIAIFFVTVLLGSCSVFNQIGGAYNLSQCDYTYKSLTNIHLAGVNLGDASSISISNLANIATILAGNNQQSIPFNMTLNMDVKNPNTAVAFLNALDYAIKINDMELAEGKMDIPIRIEPGETQTLPISIGVDMRDLMNRYSQERVANEMSSFLGITPSETTVSVKLWPKVMVGQTPVKVPTAIPVVFKFGGK